MFFGSHYSPGFAVEKGSVKAVNCVCASCAGHSFLFHPKPGPKVIKLFSCSTQLNMKIFSAHKC